MTKRTMNFNAGPAALPLAALERAQAELVDYAATGMSLMEHSHRGAAYEAVHEEAIALLRRLLSIGDNYEVLLLQGGARLQFAMVPMNLIGLGQTAYYAVTGTWGKQALGEAKLVGEAKAAANTEEPDGTFRRVPTPDELTYPSDAAYLHITSNNTLFGTAWQQYPDTGSVPLIADMTSDLAAKVIDVSRFGLIYAGAQKNVGPAGVTVVIARKDLVAGGSEAIPEVLRYRTHAEKGSLWNTPPTFAIYMLRNTLEVLEGWGGLAAVEARNRAKAKLVYEAIATHPDFYRSPVEEASRSTMNVVFRLPEEAHEKAFIAEASGRGMVGLKGHRSVGGVRASLYNAVEPAWVEALATFMDDFARRA